MEFELQWPQTGLLHMLLSVNLLYRCVVLCIAQRVTVDASMVRAENSRNLIMLVLLAANRRLTTSGTPLRVFDGHDVWDMHSSVVAQAERKKSKAKKRAAGLTGAAHCAAASLHFAAE